MPNVYYEKDDGQVLPTEQVHDSTQREEIQLMKIWKSLNKFSAQMFPQERFGRQDGVTDAKALE